MVTIDCFDGTQSLALCTIHIDRQMTNCVTGLRTLNQCSSHDVAGSRHCMAHGQSTMYPRYRTSLRYSQQFFKFQTNCRVMRLVQLSKDWAVHDVGTPRFNKSKIKMQ